MFANYHTHTTRCGHAIGTEREYIERAIENGITILGFSDHPMQPEKLDDYCRTLTALMPEYPQLEIHIGQELEYNPATFAAQLDELRQYPMEYLILGQHFLFDSPERVHTASPHSRQKDLGRYTALCREAMDTGLFTYWAHPDVINFVGDEDYYVAEMRIMCRHAADRNIPLEINLHGLQEKKHYPNDLFWHIAGEEGCPVILGTDAHDPMEFAYRHNLNAAMDIVNRFQLNLMESTPLQPIK